VALPGSSLPIRAVDQERADHGDRFMPISHSASEHYARAAVQRAIAGRIATGEVAAPRR
jgi:hypothetical protein